MKFSLLINIKMPTIVGIFIFISRENFMLGRVEHEESFIILGPGLGSGNLHFSIGKMYHDTVYLANFESHGKQIISF